MKFYTVSNDRQLPKQSPVRYPFVTLEWDNWDDYGYQTTFDVVIHLSSDENVALGHVKILKKQQKSGKTPLPGLSFTTLSAKYCSLGHSLEYYEQVFKFGSTVRRKYLEAIGDVVFDDDRRAEFEDLEGYKVSLLRFSGSERLIEHATKLFKGNRPPRIQRRRGFSIKFKTPLGSHTPSIIAEFNFNRKGTLPNRINALIGYNGTGKTKLLSNLAIVASEYGYNTKQDRVDDRAGYFVGSKPPFVRVIVVSYSAFDTFVIPNRIYS